MEAPVPKSVFLLAHEEKHGENKSGAKQIILAKAGSLGRWFVVRTQQALFVSALKSDTPLQGRWMVFGS